MPQGQITYPTGEKPFSSFEAALLGYFLALYLGQGYSKFPPNSQKEKNLSNKADDVLQNFSTLSFRGK